MSICKLCQKDKTLLRKSHIIPDFMYQELYDKNHKLISINPREYFKGEDHIKNPSSGEYEAGILCSDCDNKIIGLYETYAAETLFGPESKFKNLQKIEYYNGNSRVPLSVCKDIDYKCFKLFLLSILWRSSISKRNTFQNVYLGPHEEILRKMILEGNPGEINEYPIFTMTYLNDKSMPRDLILAPDKKRTIDGHIIYMFPIGGLIYCFYVNSKQHSIPNYIKFTTLSAENKLHVLHIPKGEAWDFIFRYTGVNG